MRVIGKMIRQMAMENTHKKMVQFSKVRGKMINNMVKELRYGEIRLNMKEIILREKSMVKEYLPLQTEVFTKEILKITS